MLGIKVDSSSGVANVADPTAWDCFTVTIAGRVRVRLIGMFGEVVAYINAGRRELFVSSAINSKLHPLMVAAYNRLWDAQQAEIYAEYGDPYEDMPEPEMEDYWGRNE